MTKVQAEKIFKVYVLPFLNNPSDSGERRQAWAFHVDQLERDGRISQSQAMRWTTPSYC